jgi:hypothetical protein
MYLHIYIIIELYSLEVATKSTVPNFSWMQLANLGIEWMIKIGICDISKVLYTIKKIWVHLDGGKRKIYKGLVLFARHYLYLNCQRYFGTR